MKVSREEIVRSINHSLNRLSGHVEKVQNETDGNAYDKDHLHQLDETLDNLVQRYIGY